jgi:putative transposase
MPSRYYAGTYVLEGRHLSLPTARGCPPLALRLSRPVPYDQATVRSVTLVNVGPKLFVDVTAEVPVASYADGKGPDPARVAGVDLGIIHRRAVSGVHSCSLMPGGNLMRYTN